MAWQCTVQRLRRLPFSQNSYWQTWEHYQSLLCIWAVQLFSFTTSISERYYWVENGPSPIRNSLDKRLWVCFSSYRHGGRCGEEFFFPLIQQPRSVCSDFSAPLHWGGRSLFYSEEAKRDAEGSAPLGEDGETTVTASCTAERETALHHQSIPRNPSLNRLSLES